jgi:hypothetical protein
MEQENKAKSSRHLIGKKNSFHILKRGRSTSGVSSDISSNGSKSNRHLIFLKVNSNQRGKSKPLVHASDQNLRGRNRRNMRKPNSFSQIDNIHKNRYANESQMSKNNMESSQCNLSLDSDSNSNKSTVMVPKLSKSDVASFLNEGND